MVFSQPEPLHAARWWAAALPPCCRRARGARAVGSARRLCLPGCTCLSKTRWN